MLEMLFDVLLVVLAFGIIALAGSAEKRRGPRVLT